MGCLKLTYRSETEILEPRGREEAPTLKVVHNKLNPSSKSCDENYRYGYQGEYSEDETDETGFNSFQLRLYDPVIGRWISVDPMREFASPYVGNGNNPISLTDPDGACNGCPDPTEGTTVTDANGDSYTGHDGNWHYNIGRVIIDNHKPNEFAAASDNTSFFPDVSPPQPYTLDNLFADAMNDKRVWAKAYNAPWATEAWKRELFEGGIRAAQNRAGKGVMVLGLAAADAITLGSTSPVRLALSARIMNSYRATGGLKQWVRIGNSYSRSGGFKTYGIRWGASPRYLGKIKNPYFRGLNKSFRNTRLPGNSWRVQDPGHYHLWAK